MTDKYHGQGGTYEVDKASGERVLKEGPTKPEPPGGGARDSDGKPIAKPVSTTESALPAPAPAPWATPQAASSDTPIAAEPATPKKKGA